MRELIPDKIQQFLNRVVRWVLIHRRGADIKPTTNIDFSVKVVSAKKMKILDNCFIGKDCYLDCSGGVEIGKNSIIAPSVFVASRNHVFDDANLPTKEQGYVYKMTIIGEDCWIGFGAKIMPGVTLGKGCVVGAGSVVTKSFDDFDVVAGNPAKRISSRRPKN